MRSGIRGAVSIAILLAACTPAPSPVIVAPSANPSSAVVTAPPPSPTTEPTQEPQPLPTSTTTGWWGEDAGHFCSFPVSYRLDGKVDGIGPCFGLLFDPPNKTVRMRVGQDLDLQMTVATDGGAPRYPLPESLDRLVMDAWYIADAATMTYRALSPGTTRLMTTGSCLVGDDSPSGVHQVTGPCPVVDITVDDIPSECNDVPEDLCRAAAATAILWGPAEKDGRIVSWQAHPGSGKEWPGCGRIAVEVALTLRDPDWVDTIVIGQVEPGSLDHLAECTY